MSHRRTVELLDAMEASSPSGDDDARERIRALTRGPAAFARTTFDPGHITGSAFVVHPEEPRVALLLHSKLQRWLQPGGHVEPDDDTVEAAAIREVAEEVGVRPGERPWMVDVDIHTFPRRGADPEHLHHDVRYAFRADRSELTLGDGADDVRWWPFEECLGMERSIARPVAGLIERYGSRG